MLGRWTKEGRGWACAKYWERTVEAAGGLPV